jgi:hypothetical protein
MVKTFTDALMSAEADTICGAPYGQRSEERTNQRNGYRQREWDTRTGTIELAIPKLRSVLGQCTEQPEDLSIARWAVAPAVAASVDQLGPVLRVGVWDDEARGSRLVPGHDVSGARLGQLDQVVAAGQRRLRLQGRTQCPESRARCDANARGRGEPPS